MPQKKMKEAIQVQVSDTTMLKKDKLPVAKKLNAPAA
jgi:hypothetical protein